DAFNLPSYEKLQDHPVLKTDPKYAAIPPVPGVQYHLYGWPAPGTDKVQRITNEYLLPNMVAKAVTGTSTKEAMAWAEKEMKRITTDCRVGVGSVDPTPPVPRTGLRVRELLDRERFLGPAFVTPALLLILLLVAYPFGMAFYFALSNAFIGRPSHFV